MGTTSQLDTPVNYPLEDVTEIEVTDSAHPLFGRRFPIRFMSAPERGASHILVAYRDFMTLRIPLTATNLIASRPSIPTKLTFAAVTELITLAEQCEALCPSDPAMSGDTCPQPCNSRSATISRPSSLR
jgi:hypothetical protein